MTVHHQDMMNSTFTLGGNLTDAEVLTFATNVTKELSISQQVTVVINRYAIPVIVVLGLVGNTLSFLVFTRSHLRYQSCSVYLAFLSLVDSGYLLMLFVSWFGWVGIHVLHWNGWCQVVVYLTYVFSFLSVWTVAAFTVERFIVVFKPLLRQHLCTRKRAKIVVTSLTVFSLLAYSVLTWTTGINNKMCVPYSRYVKLTQVINYIDTAITLAIPSVMLIVLNCCTGYKVYSFLNREGLRRSPGRTVLYQTSATCPLCETQRENTVHYTVRGPKLVSLRPLKCTHALNNAAPPTTTRSCSRSCSSSDRQQQNSSSHNSEPAIPMHETTRTRSDTNKMSTRSSRSAMAAAAANANPSRREFQIRTTATLVLVSTAFVLLNLPSHICRMHTFITKFKNNQFEPSVSIEIWSHLSLLLYYLNFAVNFLMYVAWSKYFRDALRRMCYRANNRLRSGLRKFDYNVPLLCTPQLPPVIKADVEPRPSTLSVGRK